MPGRGVRHIPAFCIIITRVQQQKEGLDETFLYFASTEYQQKKPLSASIFSVAFVRIISSFLRL